MSFARRRFIRGAAVLAAAVSLSLPALAQTAGKDYTPINPVQPTDDPARIEVVEFFSYGCPHCADFGPQLNAWAERLPADVVLRKVPITFGRAAWANIAKLYYTLEVTGDQKRLESAIFDAIHKERVNLFEEKALTAWVVSKGVDGKKFAETFNSFGVMSKVRRGDQMAQAYKITGVPALAVQGKYLVGGKDHTEALAITDKLIAKARTERK